MTSKPLEYGAHALQRLAKRGITRRDVRWLLASGITVGPTQRAHLPVRHRKRGYIGKNEAEVVYVEDARRIRIVTVMWVARGRDR